jgi:hypothetical protein
MVKVYFEDGPLEGKFLVLGDAYPTFEVPIMNKILYNNYNEDSLTIFNCKVPTVAYERIMYDILTNVYDYRLKNKYYRRDIVERIGYEYPECGLFYGYDEYSAMDCCNTGRYEVVYKKILKDEDIKGRDIAYLF